ncbi:MAG: cell division protein FtsB [Nitrosospira sp.]
MKVLGLLLAALIVLLQYPLWLGKGSWLKVWEFDQQVLTQHEINQKLRIRNATLDAEVRDLKQGFDAIEERARSELGMIRQDEIFFHILEDNKKNTLQTDRNEERTPE